MERFKDFIFKYQNSIFKPAFIVRKIIKDKKLNKKYGKQIELSKNIKSSKIFYCGIPAHGNLGDLAQGVCIRRWIKKNYASYHLVEIETDALVNTRYSLLNELKDAYKDGDIIVFQSGYTTTDLGGWADLMHQAVLQALPNAKVLMMPQTIFFKSAGRKKQCSDSYNAHKTMLFLARDNVSYEMAKEMFPDISTKCYPDIVTTLIGTVASEQERDGIIFCLRDDGEKYYSDDELDEIMNKCSSFAKIDRTDTTKGKNVVAKAEEYINSEIEKYSKYRVMVTDRYHGTILSLVAGTPVVILKTTDHKVITGADWFKGIYDDYVYVADNLEDAYCIILKLYQRKEYHTLESYFEKEYYDKLPALFEESIK